MINMHVGRPLLRSGLTSYIEATLVNATEWKSHWHLAQGCFIETVLGITPYKLLGNYVIKNTANSGFLPDRIIHKNLFKPQRTHLTHNVNAIMMRGQLYALYEPGVVSLLTLIGITRPRWVNSVTPWEIWMKFLVCSFQTVKQILVINGWGISCEIALIWMSLDSTDDLGLDELTLWPPGNLNEIFGYVVFKRWNRF